jgi:hypothetical protein
MKNKYTKSAYEKAINLIASRKLHEARNKRPVATIADAWPTSVKEEKKPYGKK